MILIFITELKGKFPDVEQLMKNPQIMMTSVIVILKTIHNFYLGT